METNKGMLKRSVLAQLYPIYPRPMKERLDMLMIWFWLCIIDSLNPALIRIYTTDVRCFLLHKQKANHELGVKKNIVPLSHQGNQIILSRSFVILAGEDRPIDSDLSVLRLVLFCGRIQRSSLIEKFSCGKRGYLINMLRPR